jgi:hypothetical protein
MPNGDERAAFCVDILPPTSEREDVRQAQDCHYWERRKVLGAIRFPRSNETKAVFSPMRQQVQQALEIADACSVGSRSEQYDLGSGLYGRDQSIEDSARSLSLPLRKDLVAIEMSLVYDN